MNIKELAEQAGANVLETSAWTIIQLNTGDQTKFLEHFAELVAAAASAKEREACAKLCEPQEAHDDPLTAYNIAQLIRARGDKHE